MGEAKRRGTLQERTEQAKKRAFAQGGKTLQENIEIIANYTDFDHDCLAKQYDFKSWDEMYDTCKNNVLITGWINKMSFGFEEKEVHIEVK